MPFSDVDLDMGPPSFVPGSHKWGVLRMKPSRTDGKEGEPYVIADTDRIERADFVKRRISASQALVFHTLMVHRSEPNTAKKAKLSIQVRFDDLLDTTSFAKNYPEGMYLGQSPGKIYPEFVVRIGQE
jgi:ectoine hydroxylase-related dioxygenase (phytanoyl-CoA dioxygenase family)